MATSGSLFGAPPAQSQPSFGITPSFGAAPTQSQQPTLSFGSASTFGQTSGAPASMQPFGTGAAPSFGAPAGQTQSFGTTQPFGATPQSQSSLFSFGNPTLTSSQPGQLSSTGFGLGQSGFGTAPRPAAPSFSFPSFSTGQQGQTPSLFGNTAQQPSLLQQPLPFQQPIDEAQAFQQSVFQCHKFGDERDSTLAALNYLQSCWGSGKGYYSQTLPPSSYNQLNPFYRFKAVGYAFMYTDSNEDGLVVINFKKPQDKVTAEETNIISSMQQMLNRPNILIRFSGTKAVSEESTVAIIFAEDRNTLRRVPATDMAAALCQSYLKPQLENIGVTNVSPKVKPSPEQLKRYLETAPDGIDPRVWHKAQEDNPDSKLMIPIPLIGPEALKSRIEWQEKETLQHHARLKLISEDVGSLLNRHANMTAELQQMKRKHIVLTHRLISIICRQELMRKQGTTLQPDEEILKKNIEEMDSELNSPTQYKGRLNELLSQIRLHKSTHDSRPTPRYNIDPSSLAPVKEFLTIQQESVKHLVGTIKADQECVKQMLESINKVFK